ncbi:MAG: FkbM family methyltransferase [Lentisphaeria bacterium]|nr:FkbM family methyltransferase [Lentisphaeria bacterium]
MKKLIVRFMEHEALKKQPPVLVDVGASGEVHKEWALIAPYAICIAFDGDDRELKSIRSCSSGYRDLIVYHRVLSAVAEEHTDFYLTASPYCSSTLEPDRKGLESYHFCHFFDVQKKLQLKAVTLDEVLKENNLKYIDWFKTDSQGTDLRLFTSLSDEQIDFVKIAEFEPGLIDAYCGEDKFYDLLKWINSKNFFLDTLNVEYVYRIKPETTQKFNFSPKVWRYVKPVPGWVNLTFLNTGKNWENWSLRDCLFFIVCGLINHQYGMVLEFSSLMKQRFPEEELFSDAAKYAEKKLRPNFFKLCLSLFHRKLFRFLLIKLH